MLKVRNLKLLNDKVIYFEARPGDVIFIKGANGVGKSLFLKSLARLIPSHWEELSLENKSTSQYPIELWRSKVFYLPPEVSFADEFTVEDFLNEPLSLTIYKNHKSDFDPRKYLTNLSGRMNLLSSGQRQRVALLRALSLNSDVLLLDESFGQMDLSTREEFFSLFANWLSKGKILLIVTHFEIKMSHFATREYSL